jgi:PAS domain-containing protein
LAEQIPHIVWMASPGGKIEFLNQQGRDYLGWSSEGAPRAELGGRRPR